MWAGWRNPLAWLLLLYSAVGPGAIADVLQNVGQTSVTAAEANVILCAEPVFTALCSRVFLGELTTADLEDLMPERFRQPEALLESDRPCARDGAPLARPPIHHRGADRHDQRHEKSRQGRDKPRHHAGISGAPRVTACAKPG